MKKEVIAGAYKIRNIINGKIYIGSSFNIYKRWRIHKKALKNETHQPKLQNSWNKYGEQNFVFEFIEIVDVSECKTKLEIKNKILEREQHYLDTLLFASKNNNEFNVLGYNICRIAGSTLGTKQSKKTKEKLSKIRIKKWKNKTFRKKMIAELQSRAKESGKTRSVTMKKNKVWQGEDNPMKETNLYEIWIEKYGKKEANERKDMAKKKYSKNRKGVPINRSKDGKLKAKTGAIAKLSKPVLQCNKRGEAIQSFISVREAMRSTKIARGGINAVIYGQQKTAGGFIWKRITKNEYLKLNTQV